MKDILSGGRFFTTRQAAELLGVTAPTVISWVKQGRLEALRTPGGHRRIPLASLQEFAEECGTELPGFDRVAPNTATVKTRVLVVDNETDFAEMVAEFLNLHEDVLAQCAVEPIDVGYQLATFGPDVVVCAVEVPGVPPKAIARKLMASKARMILVTSIKTSHDESLAKELGVDAVVEKPIKLEALLQLIRP